MVTNRRRIKMKVQTIQFPEGFKHLSENAVATQNALQMAQYLIDMMGEAKAKEFMNLCFRRAHLIKEEALRLKRVQTELQKTSNGKE